MTKFTFPLNRVHEYRRSQARLEEAKLEQLHAEMRAIEDRQFALAAELAESQQRLLTAASATASELATLDSFRRYTAFAAVRAERARVECEHLIKLQIDAVTRRRRDVKLLDNLKDRRLRVWKQGLEKEIAQQAEESFISRVVRESRPLRAA